MRAARHRSWHESWRTVRGVARSLRTYYGISADRAAMDRLYGQFVQAGDLVFDIGAHVGGRTAAFRRLGARVVAVEPQPALVRTLKLLYGRDRAVSFEFTTIQRGVAAACIERCAQLGYAHYNAVLGDRQALVHHGWVSAEEIAALLSALPQNANSGDIYARLPGRRP